ncbi:MAG: UDP-N-acetylmuramoyl-L-alanyl-D-glutamate--2,6-diaminopimelate ligase, partial [Clostridia bacterium]|nr:UDP-N-acetylmuramoyl-L-alanyl-D-glutamate--2,6-diaminopimelate ligase [Clostridia bacterium]
MTRTLYSLLRDAPPTRALPEDISQSREISAIYSDSREAPHHGDGGLFVCIAGAAFDGHAFARRAYDDGCRTFAVMHPLELPADTIQLVYEDTRRALAQLSAAFYGHPSKELTVFGITGTKGKTTTALMTYELLSRAGISAAYIGSNGIRYGDTVRRTKNTTPESLVLQKTMRELCDCGIRVLVMEVSSQAIMQHRIDGIAFDTVLFTNLSPDHIGPTEHPTFEAYKSEKRKLFSDYGAKTVILNADDPAATEMLPPSGTVVTFSVKGSITDALLPAPKLSARDIRLSAHTLGNTFLLCDAGGTETEVDLPLPGVCNVENLLGALSLCETVGPLPGDLKSAILSMQVEGRAETIVTEDRLRIVIDYAHNEASMREILTALAKYPHGRLTVLFGSVGGRTEARRGAMGAVASELADFCILTSDNPDRESPEAIMNDILAGFKRDCPYVMIADRREAIEYSLSTARPNDILLLAGKGHEGYQRVDGKDLPFSEREIVERYLASHPRTVPC